MVLDQQIPLERAFKAPLDLQARLGGQLEVEAIASMDPEELASAFGAKPALHRFPKSMAGRVQEVCTVIVDSYGGDAAAIWTTATDGEQKARIFTALLGKQLGVRPAGWEDAAAPFGEPGTFRSVADIDSPEASTKVRQYKQQVKAEARSRASTPG
jgi:uncharacterized HhH-GPD family protein